MACADNVELLNIQTSVRSSTNSGFSIYSFYVRVSTMTAILKLGPILSLRTVEKNRN